GAFLNSRRHHSSYDDSIKSSTPPPNAIVMIPAKNSVHNRCKLCNFSSDPSSPHFLTNNAPSELRKLTFSSR
ncbi:2716_t:CDS:2, partial [Acaulospora morrowiae]